MNPDLNKLHSYPFEKLAALFAGVTVAEKKAIALSIGEPKHPAPEFVKTTLVDNLSLLSKYPTTKGLPELRDCIAQWIQQRFKTDTIDPETQVLPVNGTREALFAFAQAMIDRTAREPLVLMPNPFYQIYEGASLLAGADPYYLDCLAENNFIPDFENISEQVWDRCQILFICSPGNPTGAVMDHKLLSDLIALADQHGFIIAADECYSEIYFDESNPPTGLLETCARIGRNNFKRCVVFHSLSKRSNLPGLRSGFIAGDSDIISRFFKYRTYHGCAMSVPNQLASISAWSDEAHVAENREKYRQKFSAVLPILKPVLEVDRPDAGFYLWAKTPTADEEFAKGLVEQQNVIVLPGSYLSRTSTGRSNGPGNKRIRMALVASLAECVEAAERIREYVTQL